MSKAVMQQALDALKDLKKFVTDDGAMPEHWDAHYEPQYYALEALEAELAKPELPQTDLRKAAEMALDALKYNQSNWYGKREAIAALEAELAKPDQPDLRKAVEMAVPLLIGYREYSGDHRIANRCGEVLEALRQALARDKGEQA